MVALIGGILSLIVIYGGRKSPQAVPILFEPARSPYSHFIAGEGSVESLNENISLSVVFPELVTNVYCQVGDLVKKNDPLFRLDTRRLDANLRKALEELAAARTQFENKSINFSYYERLTDKAAISEQDYTVAFYEKELAYNQVEVATAAVNEIKIDLERSITRAPSDGQILQINIREGEFANVNPFNGIPLIIFGDTSSYHLRVTIDEAEAWRFKKNQPGTAFVRGNAKIRIPLEFDHVEPLMVPKKSLTGSNTERVDTRGLQVVFRLCKEDYPIYLGQLLDVFIKAEPYESAP